MTFRTSMRRLSQEPLHPVWLILAGCEIAAVIACFNHFVLGASFVSGWNRPPGQPGLAFSLDDINHIFWGSYVGAGGIRLREGLALFSGRSVAGIWDVPHTLVLTSMVISYILAPALLVWGLKARKRWLVDRTAGPSPRVILAATALGGYIAAGALLIPAGAGWGTWHLWQVMKADQEINAVRDAAISSVSALGCRAQELRWMPPVGGGGPWRDSQGGISVADLEKVLPGLKKAIWHVRSRTTLTYLLRVHSPDSLTIWGIADAGGRNADSLFRNRDGRVGNIQVRAGVTPLRVTLLVEN